MREVEVDTRLLSNKAIPAHERLIFPLDVPTREQGLEWVDRLGETVHFYKLGLELFLAGNYIELLHELTRRKKRVLVDLKFFDVPETVAAAVKQIRSHGADFATVHGNEEMIEAACREKDGLKILAVTVLTSWDENDIRDLGATVSVQQLVLSRARRALLRGCDGVISSGLEIRALRDQFGDGFFIVSPGIRPVENRLTDDHKRVVSVEEAFAAGADYIIMGRPIRNAPNPVEKAKEIQETIARLF